MRAIWRGLAVLLLCVGMNAGAAETAVEGTDYITLNPTQPTSNPGKVVVTEFFSYMCSHCYAFYPVVTPWSEKLGKDVVFERVPVSLGRSSWQPIAQAFYALQAMGLEGKYDKAIFNGIFTQNAKLYDEDNIVAFLGKLGVSADDFRAAYHSFSVESKVKQAEQMMKTHKVSGTPTMVVDGKYVVQNEGTKDYADLLARTDRVIAKARASHK